jgi:hypothetical protein
MGFVADYPWLLPGSLVAFVLAVPLSTRASRWLRTTRPVAWVILLSLGVILAATLTPPGADPAFRVVAVGSCDLSRFGPPSLAQLLAPSDVTGNILGFIPLGFAIGLVPGSRRKALALAAAAALPFAIEATQLLVTSLGRVCQSGDVVDNLTGLAIGLVLGFGAAAALRRRSPARRPPGTPAG